MIIGKEIKPPRQAVMSAVFFAILTSSCKTQGTGSVLATNLEEVTPAPVAEFPVRGSLKFRAFPPPNPRCIEIACQDHHGLLWGESLALTGDLANFRPMLAHLRCRIEKPEEIATATCL